MYSCMHMHRGAQLLVRANCSGEAWRGREGAGVAFRQQLRPPPRRNSCARLVALSQQLRGAWAASRPPPLHPPQCSLGSYWVLEPGGAGGSLRQTLLPSCRGALGMTLCLSKLGPRGRPPTLKVIVVELRWRERGCRDGPGVILPGHFSGTAFTWGPRAAPLQPPGCSEAAPKAVRGGSRPVARPGMAPDPATGAGPCRAGRKGPS